MIALHLFLLLACIVVCLASVAIAPARPSRSLLILMGFCSPFVLMGILSALLLSSTGSPTIEWIVPLLCTLVIMLFCRNMKLAVGSYCLMIVASLAMCANFIILTHSGYTANPRLTRHLDAVRRDRLLAQAQKALDAASAQDKSKVQSGPIPEVLADPKLNSIDVKDIVGEWHTPMTRLYLIRQTTGKLRITGTDPLQVELQAE